jgi:PAS domain S-box-containing protein
MSVASQLTFGTDEGHLGVTLETALMEALARDAVLIRDFEDGAITLWSHGAQETYGWTAEQAVGRVSHELLATESAVPLEVIHRTVLEQGRWDGELIQRRIDGTKITVASRWALQRGDRGSPIAALEINTDITERKRAEALLEANRLELERSNLDLASFAYVASHDLQEPLRMVSSYVQLLADRYRGKLDADADDFIHFAVDGAMRMQTLIRSILDYSRVGTVELSLVAVDTNELLVETLSSLRSAIRDRHAEVAVEHLPVLVGDRTQLGQVFQNLISNSIKFTAHGVTPRVRVSAARRDDGWRFSVEDNGIGIDQGHAGRIFAPFKRLHSHAEYPGAGLGLSVCKRAVERQGGRISVEGAPGGGSVFTFTIPDRSEEPDAH